MGLWNFVLEVAMPEKVHPFSFYLRTGPMCSALVFLECAGIEAVQSFTAGFKCLQAGTHQVFDTLSCYPINDNLIYQTVLKSTIKEAVIPELRLQKYTISCIPSTGNWTGKA